MGESAVCEDNPGAPRQPQSDTVAPADAYDAIEHADDPQPPVADQLREGVPGQCPENASAGLQPVSSGQETAPPESVLAEQEAFALEVIEQSSSVPAGEETDVAPDLTTIDAAERGPDEEDARELEPEPVAAATDPPVEAAAGEVSGPPEPGVAAGAAAWTDAGSGIEPASAEEPAQPPPTEPSDPDPGATVTVSAEEIIGTETLDSRESEAPPVPHEPAYSAIAGTEHAEPEHVPEAQVRDSNGASEFEVAREVAPERPAAGPAVEPEAVGAQAPEAEQASWSGVDDEAYPPRQGHDTLAVLPEAQSGAVPPADDGPLPEPVREEQVWSGPEDSDPVSSRAGHERKDAVWQFREEARARADADGHREGSRVASGAAAAVLPARGWTGQPAAAWPSVSLPSRDRPGAGRSYLRLALRIGASMVLAYAAAVLALIVLYRWVDPPASTLMLGQRLLGTEIEQRWVPLRRISGHLVQAVILSEDGGFCRHRGVDWSALSEAIEDSRGGSTITMQVVKNLFLWPARSYVRKGLEIVLAYAVELVWPKQRILEIYLNIAEWGPGVFGAEVAALHHFRKPASELTAQEAALLAVSLPNPIERQAGYPGWQTRRLANNLLIRMRSVRAPSRCVRVSRSARQARR
jgi:monofunctional biosynthetic peptidoglycan transglycosylase